MSVQENQTVVGYTFVVGVACLARVTLSLLEVPFATPAQRAMWSWPVFAIFLLAFAVAAFFASRARLPAPGDTLRSPLALGLAIAIGATVGCLTVWSDWVSPAAAARGLSTLHVSGYAAGPFYVYGAILITVLFHFLPMAAAAWLARQLPAARARLLLSAAVVFVAFSEDISFFRHAPDLRTVEAARHALSVAANAAEAILIYRYGLLAGLLQRGTTYLLWHVLWPNIGLT